MPFAISSNRRHKFKRIKNSIMDIYININLNKKYTPPKIYKMWKSSIIATEI